jgi:hypothetical protein
MANVAPIVDDITIVQGMYFSRIFRVKQGGTAFPWSGYTGRAQVRAGKNLDSELRLTFTVTLDDPLAGDVKIELGATDSNDFPGAPTSPPVGGEQTVAIGYYDVESEPGGDADGVIRIAQGAVMLDTNVTQP